MRRIGYATAAALLGALVPSICVAEDLAPKQLKRPLEEIVNRTGMKLRYIPPGEFVMGSAESEKGREDDESPRHRVKLTRGFYLGATEVTRTQWRTDFRFVETILEPVSAIATGKSFVVQDGAPEPIEV